MHNRIKILPAVLSLAVPALAIASDSEKPRLDAATEQALIGALEDEYKARALYEKILERFGPVRPFSNIVRAEQRHIERLLPLFARYDVAVPEDTWPQRVSAPATLREACADGVTAEEENAALYEGYLSTVQAPDVRAVFLYLRDASQDHHRPAFQRCLDRRGDGSGRGKGWSRARGAR